MALATQTRRVKVLEDGAGGSGRPPCDRCGWGGGEEPFDFGPDDGFEIVFDDVPEEEEFCPECGRRVIIVVRFEEERP